MSPAVTVCSNLPRWVSLAHPTPPSPQACPSVLDARCAGNATTLSDTRCACSGWVQRPPSASLGGMQSALLYRLLCCYGDRGEHSGRNM